MEVFRTNAPKSVRINGPMTKVTVNVPALKSVVGSKSTSTWMLMDMHYGAREIVDVRQCFNDVSFIYALGNKQEACVISLKFAVFLGSCGGGDGTKNIKLGLESYIGGRISNNTKPQTITIGGFSCYGWLTGIDIGQVDIERSVCYATAHFILELKA